MTTITVVLESEVGELVYDVLKKAYDILLNPEVEKVTVMHNKHIFIIKEE